MQIFFRKRKDIDLQGLITKLVDMIQASKYQDTIARGLLCICLKCTQAYVWHNVGQMSVSVMTTTSPDDSLTMVVHGSNQPLRFMWNDVILQDLISLSNAHQCTCHVHKSCPITMMNSCPHHHTATTKMVDCCMHFKS